MTPFLRVWCQFTTAITSQTVVTDHGDYWSFEVEDASNFSIDDSVEISNGEDVANGIIYYVDYTANVIVAFSPGFDITSADTMTFKANYMFYGTPYLGVVRYLEWRNIARNVKNDIIEQPDQLQVVEWTVPLLLNGVTESCVDRTLTELLQMFEELSDKPVLVELLDKGFVQRLFESYITTNSFPIQEMSDGDIGTEITFVGLLEVGV